MAGTYDRLLQEKTKSMLRLACVLFAACPLFGETGYYAWLRYAPVDDAAARSLPAVLSVAGDSPIDRAARAPNSSAAYAACWAARCASKRVSPRRARSWQERIDDLRQIAPQLNLDAALAPDAFF